MDNYYILRNRYNLFIYHYVNNLIIAKIDKEIGLEERLDITPWNFKGTPAYQMHGQRQYHIVKICFQRLPKTDSSFLFERLPKTENNF